MRIYNTVKVPQGLGYDDYEAIYQSGYTAGYEEGYNSAPCYKRQYCTIEALEDGNINIGNNVQYSINDGDWVSGASGDIIAVQSGDITRFKGINAGQNAFRGSTVKCIAYGNVMSLLYGDDFIGKTEAEGYGGMAHLFYECINLVDASNLILPATTVGLRSYWNMFRGCTRLVSAPALPATTLNEGSYGNMFSGCTSLATAPELPATTLAESCYQYMFQGCTSLTAAPELPATTLAEKCYIHMFGDCTNLNYIKCLATDNTALGCTANWLWGVAASGTFVKDANATWKTGTNGIPENWTVQDAQ